MKRGDIVSFWVYMGNQQTATGIVSDCALVYGRVVGVGKERVTLITEYGDRTWKRSGDVTLSPEGIEYFKEQAS